MDLFSKLKEMQTLLIDDDEWIRDSLCLFFESEGCRLLAFETAEEALEELKSQVYDLIIVDYKLPGMDGLEFLKRIQKAHSNTLKVLISAYGSNEVVSEAKKLGIHDFIEKPFTSESIEASLAGVIKNY